MTHVPYRGSAPAIADLLAGRIDAMFDSATSVAPHVDTGRLRALAVATRRRSALQPALPTVAEVGVPSYAVDWWYALLAPRSLPEVGRRRIGDAVRETLAEPALRKRFADIQVEPMEGDPITLATLIEQDRATWHGLVQRLGLQGQ